MRRRAVVTLKNANPMQPYLLIPHDDEPSLERVFRHHAGRLFRLHTGWKPDVTRSYPREYAIRAMAYARRLDSLLVSWRSDVESTSELKDLSRVTGDIVARINARYKEIESSVLTVERPGEKISFGDSIGASFYQAARIAKGRIHSDPNVLGGKPYIRGTRIPIYTILEHLADGYTVKRVLNEFPDLTAEDVYAALLFASIVCAEPWKKA